jgi:hypothetical protein
MAPKRTSREWFEEAARCYIERHQGCPWCGGSYRVYQIQRGHDTVYYCHGCDFRAEGSVTHGHYHHVPGEELAPTRPTMLDLEI